MKWLLVVALFGCKDPDPVDVLHRFTDEMCSCKTEACARGVNDRLTQWSEVVSNKRDPRLVAAIEPYMVCFVKLLM
jgi:hypothetical protein